VKVHGSSVCESTVVDSLELPCIFPNAYALYGVPAALERPHRSFASLGEAFEASASQVNSSACINLGDSTYFLPALERLHFYASLGEANTMRKGRVRVRWHFRQPLSSELHLPRQPWRGCVLPASLGEVNAIHVPRLTVSQPHGNS